MATVYIDSAATGGGTGADWTNAYTTILAAITAKSSTAPHDYLVDDGHVEGASYGAAQELNFGNGANTLTSVDKADDSYSKGATLNNTSVQNVSFAGDCAVYGVIIKNERNISFKTSAAYHWLFNDCEIHLTRTTANNIDNFGIGTGASNDYGLKVVVESSGIVLYEASQGLYLTHYGKLYLYDVTFTGTTPTNLVNNAGADGHFLEARDCDFNGCTNLYTNGISSGRAQYQHIDIRNCKAGTAAGFNDTTCTDVNMNANIYSLSQGTSQFYHYEEHRRHGGRCFENTSIYRTGGADNGDTTGYSTEVETVSGNLSLHRILKLPLRNLHIDLSAAAKTLTWHLIVGKATDTISAIYDQHVWIEVEYPDNTSLGLGSVVKSQTKDIVSLAASTTALTTSTASWNGTIGTYQDKRQIAVTVPQCTNASNATITAWLCVARDFTTANESFFICPDPEIS